MKKFVFLFSVMCLTACNIYTPIVHVNRYFSPTTSVEILAEPPTNFQTYFGTVKVVATDNFFPTDKDYQRAIETLLEVAKRCGANYIYIRNYDSRTSDFKYLRFLDQDYGEGVTIEAELYR